MPRGVRLRHHAAERLPQNDRLFDPKRVAKRAHIVAPLRERPGLGIARNAPPIAAMVDVDHLRDVGERVERAAQARMIEPRPAMHDDEGRLLAHRGPVRRKLRPHDVEENALPAQVDEHAAPFS